MRLTSVTNLLSSMKYKLLVVTPTLGQSEFLNQTVCSVRRVQQIAKHILVHPAKAQLGFSCGDQEMELVEGPSVRGLYAAINDAVSRYDGDWTHITYINDDDALGDEFPEAWHNHCSRTPDHFGYGRVSIIDTNGKKKTEVPIARSPRCFEALLAQGISPLNQQGMIVPRSLWQRLGGFRTQYSLCADLDFWLRAYRAKWPFAFHYKEVGKFRMRPGQLSGDIDRMRREIEAVWRDGLPSRPVDLWWSKLLFRMTNANIYLGRLIRGIPLGGIDLVGR